ncbi:MAG: M81 family metallopeptidase [Pseudomonadota bacterium]
MSARVAIAGFQHETNTFVPIPTTYEDFVRAGSWPAMTVGQAMLDAFRGANFPTAGFIDAAGDWDLVPILWAGTEPAGPVHQSAFDRIAAEICAGVQQAMPLDGVYLDLHGAMVTEYLQDPEGELVRRLRAVVGPEMPIVASLDLHGNLSPDFFDLVSAVAIYRTYPHVDMAATGARAKVLLQRLIERGKPFAKAYAQLDFMVAVQEQSTRRDPAGGLYAMLPGLERDGVVSADLAFGFPPADIHDCGISVFACGEDQKAVDAARDRLVEALNGAEDAFDNPLVPADEAVRRAIEIASDSDRPVVVCDPQDNPGAGAPGDSTGLLRAFVEGGARDTCLGVLWDPTSAARAHETGIGGYFQASLGGRYPQIGGDAVSARVEVLAVSDGSFPFTGPIFKGLNAQFGPMAALRIVDPDSDVVVVVASGRGQNADRAMIAHLGLDPLSFRILGVKSAVHFLADYEPIAETVIFAEAPGANPCQLDRIAYTRLRGGVRLGANGPPFQPEG